MWSAAPGSAPVCALYWMGRVSHGPDPPGGFWFCLTAYMLVPGYYFLAAIGGLLHLAQISQRATITLIIVFDCVFLSLVVLTLWGWAERLRKRPATPVVHD